MKKRLMFNFYIQEGWKENHINKIHFFCLKYYSEVFTEIVFMISLDNVNDVNLIYDFENYILSLELCPNIKFMVKPNHIFREAKNFYDEIVLKLKDLDGLTFFAHNKGITNYENDLYNKRDVEKWVTSMYFGCLDDPQEMEYALTEDRQLSYGTLLDILTFTEEEDEIFFREMGIWLGKRKFFYMGTFFWLNGPTIHSFFKNTETEIPPLTDRWYAENFFANIIEYKFCGSYRYRTTFNHCGFGVRYMDEIIEYSFGDDTNRYYAFHNEVLNSVR